MTRNGKRTDQPPSGDAGQVENKMVCRDLSFYLHQSVDYRNPGYVVNRVLFGKPYR
jgi:hypothetical protein